MLSPKRTKYRKPHRGRLKGQAMRGNKISFGDFALQALEPGWITSRQIEAGRRAMSRYARRGGKLWIRESSMGSMMLHPESREEVRQLLTQPPELDSILDGMEIPAIRIALRDSALLSSVDGDYDESELWALKRIAEAGGLTEDDLSKILDWVSDSWKLSANGRSIIAFPMPGDDAMI